MKKLISLILFIILVLSFTVTASAEWQKKDGQKLWYDSDGTAATGFKNIDGIGYIFSSDGYLQGKYTGVTSSSKGRKYYLNGEVVKGRWLYSGGKRTYYAGSDGYFLTGWHELYDKFKYGFDENGVFIKTNRPDFCKTDAQAAEYYKLENALYWICLQYHEDQIFSSAIVRDENGIVVAEENGETIKMIARIWVKCEDTRNEMLNTADLNYIDKKYYDIVVGENPDDRLGTPDSELYDKDDITLSLKIDGKKMTATVENKTELEYKLIEDIRIEMFDGDKWVTLPRKDRLFSNRQALAANGSATITDTFPPSDYDDDLKPGTYRAIVEISREEIEILHLYKTIKLAAQFTVE